jgi:glyoxylase-like metal-dependent hydrolase (beta-lactamase superfamily II)
VNAPHVPVLEFPYAAPPPQGATIEVAPGLFWLRMPLPFALDHINLWLAREDRGYTLIDAGFGDARTREVWNTHFATTLDGSEIVRVIATHYHPDHLGNAAWIATRFGCKVAMAAAELLYAYSIAEQRRPFRQSDYGALFAAHGMPAEHVDGLTRRGNGYARGVPELPDTYQRILAGERLRIGGRDFDVIPGYGHSPEHVSLYCADEAMLIAGDMLLPKISTNVGVSPAEPEGDTLGRFLGSLAAFEQLPADTLVLPSHGLPFRGSSVRVAQLRAHHQQRLDELTAAVATAKAPVSANDILPVLFRRPLDLQQRFFAIGEAIAHLNHLCRAGQLDRRTAPDGAVRFAALE